MLIFTGACTILQKKLRTWHYSQRLGKMSLFLAGPAPYIGNRAGKKGDGVRLEKTQNNVAVFTAVLKLDSIILLGYSLDNFKLSEGEQAWENQ